MVGKFDRLCGASESESAARMCRCPRETCPPDAMAGQGWRTGFRPAGGQRRRQGAGGAADARRAGSAQRGFVVSPLGAKVTIGEIWHTLRVFTEYEKDLRNGAKAFANSSSACGRRR